MPAMRAVANTSPLGALPDTIISSVSGRMPTNDSATASTMCDRLAAHVDHVGLAPLVEVGERSRVSGHALASDLRHAPLGADAVVMAFGLDVQRHAHDLAHVLVGALAQRRADVEFLVAEQAGAQLRRRSAAAGCTRRRSGARAARSRRRYRSSRRSGSSAPAPSRRVRCRWATGISSPSPPLALAERRSSTSSLGTVSSRVQPVADSPWQPAPPRHPLPACTR
jgi:hypothetical protein